MSDNIDFKDLQILNSNPHPGTPEQLHIVLSAFNELGRQGIGAPPNVHDHIQTELSNYLKGLTPNEQTKFGQAYREGTEQQPYQGFMMPSGSSSAENVIWHSDLPGATVKMDDYGKLQYIQFDKVGAFGKSLPSADSYRIEAPKSGRWFSPNIFDFGKHHEPAAFNPEAARDNMLKALGKLTSEDLHLKPDIGDLEWGHGSVVAATRLEHARETVKELTPSELKEVVDCVETLKVDEAAGIKKFEQLVSHYNANENTMYREGHVEGRLEGALYAVNAELKLNGMYYDVSGGYTPFLDPDDSLKVARWRLIKLR